MIKTVSKTTFQKYPAYKDSGVEWLGEIPEDWKAIRMKYVFRDYSSKNKPEAELLSVTQDKGVVPRTWVENRMVMPSGNLSSFKFIQKGDFAISLRSFEGGLEYCHHDGIISPAYTVLKKQSGLVDRYYKYLFKSLSFISEIQTSVVGIREGKNISYPELSYSLLPIPKKEEQTAIANFLDEKTAKIDRAIVQKEKLIALLKERKQIMIQDLVTGKRVWNKEKGAWTAPAEVKDSGVAWIGEIPEGWEVKKVGYFSKIGNGSTPNRGVSKYWDRGDFPWLNSSKVNQELIKESDQFITHKALAECHLPIIEKGTILMAITGEGKTRGKVAICNIRATINQHIAYIEVDKRIAHNYYLLKVFESMYNRLRANSSGQGSTKGAITCEAIGQQKVILPPLEEQLLILDFITAETQKYEKSFNINKKQIEKLKEYKATLIDSAVTGKLRVPSVQEIKVS